MRVAGPGQCWDVMCGGEGPGGSDPQDSRSVRQLREPLPPGVPDHRSDSHLDAVFR